MKKQIIYLSVFLMSLVTLQGQAVQESLPGAKEISNRKTSFNLEEIKVRWKKAALENCTGVPCTTGPGGGSFTCGTSTVADIDGNTYNTVLIGTQCWTKSNLKVTKYNDGTAIPLDASGGTNGNGAGETWSARYTSSTAAYSILSNEPSNGTNATNYGFLYNWYAVTNPKKICPAGWHVPTDAEFAALVSYSTNPGNKLKSTSALWNPSVPGAGTDNFGFSALPGGERAFSGSYTLTLSGDYAYFWTSSPDITHPTVDSWQYAIHKSDNTTIGRYSTPQESGDSVRCLKD
jgi:uncharacterized protein (TIGR02145 family)